MTQRLSPHHRKYLRHELSATIRAQVEWMNRCGGTITGYIAKYGSATDPGHSGDGGEAIYRADAEQLRKLRQELEGLSV